MTGTRAFGIITAAGMLCVAARPAVAQQASQRFGMPQDTASPARSSWPAVRIVKWGTLLGSTGALAYGFAQNRVADREYEDIERLCQSTPDACATRPGSAEYVDAALEARYQSVVRRDDRARLALLAGQIGLAAGVLLFILDLPKDTTPDDIPYDPRSLQLGVADGRIVAGWQLPL